jgi:hypothetical protein
MNVREDIAGDALASITTHAVERAGQGLERRRADGRRELQSSGMTVRSGAPWPMRRWA